MADCEAEDASDDTDAALGSDGVRDGGVAAKVGGLASLLVDGVTPPLELIAPVTSEFPVPEAEFGNPNVSPWREFSFVAKTALLAGASELFAETSRGKLGRHLNCFRPARRHSPGRHR